MSSSSITRQQTPIPNRLRDKVAIITGAAGNIGMETARRFLLEGAKVSLVDIDKEKLIEAQKSLSSSIATSSTSPSTSTSSPEDSILTVEADVTSEEDVQRYVEQTVEHFGRLDIAFLCAGISYSSTSILETSVDLYDKVMKVNCRSGECLFFFSFVFLFFSFFIFGSGRGKKRGWNVEKEKERKKEEKEKKTSSRG